MVDVWAVIGNQNAGKTSTIRALTGVPGKRRTWDVAYSANGPSIPTYVHPQALQEGKIAPAAFIADVKKAKVSRVIVALRLKAARGQPDAQGYLSQFLQAGWTVNSAVLNPAKPLQGILTKAVKLRGRPLPSNQIARQLRQRWGIA
jgi:hypothetical protein